MSVLTPSKVGDKPTQKTILGKQKNQTDSSKGKRPRKSKKDYVYKLWAALSKRCEAIVEEYNGKLTRNQEKVSASGRSENKSDTKEEEEERNVGISFEDLGAFMANKQLIVLVGKFWALLRSYVNNESIRKESMKDARIILSTLMISMFPNDLLDASDAADMDPLSRACFTAAQRVLMQVFVLKKEEKQIGKSEDNVSKLSVNKTKFHCQQAYKAINDFLNAFKDWQTQDKTKLIKIGLNQYEQWQRSYQVIKVTNMNQGQKEEILKVIEINISNMKERISQVLDGNKEKMNQLCSYIDEKLKQEQEEAAHQQQEQQQEQQASGPVGTTDTTVKENNSTVSESIGGVGTVESVKQYCDRSSHTGATDSGIISSSTSMSSGDNNGHNGGQEESSSSNKIRKPQGRQKENSTSNENTPVKRKKTQQEIIEEKLRARGVPVNMKTGRNLSGYGSSSSNTNSFSNSPASGNNSSNNFNFCYSDSEEKKSDKENDAYDASNASNSRLNDAKYMTEINGNKFLNLDAIIMEEASKKYWLDFENEILNENWSRLFELLTEILQRVKKLSPKKDGKMLDDMLDVKFIQQTIENGLIDANGFYGIFFGIWKQLKSLHAPARDDDWNKWHDKILKDMSKSDATWATLLSHVFNTFLIKIDEIEDQTNAIYQSVKNNNKK